MSLRFNYGKGRFEITREGGMCVGYRNGRRSITGPDTATVMRGLIKKHVQNQPSAKVLPFGRSELCEEVPFRAQ